VTTAIVKAWKAIDTSAITSDDAAEQRARQPAAHARSRARAATRGENR
jgi:hypothetical protein